MICIITEIALWEDRQENFTNLTNLLTLMATHPFNLLHPHEDKGPTKEGRTTNTHLLSPLLPQAANTG